LKQIGLDRTKPHQKVISIEKSNLKQPDKRNSIGVQEHTMRTNWYNYTSISSPTPDETPIS
jgi:hypothetical protein